jgi:hypothetical protein
MSFPTPIPAQHWLGTWQGITYYTRPNVDHILTRKYIPPGPPNPWPIDEQKAIKDLNTLWNDLTPEERASWKGYRETTCHRKGCKHAGYKLPPRLTFMSFNIHIYWDEYDANTLPATYARTPP